MEPNDYAVFHLWWSVGAVAQTGLSLDKHVALTEERKEETTGAK